MSQETLNEEKPGCGCFYVAVALFVAILIEANSKAGGFVFVVTVAVVAFVWHEQSKEADRKQAEKRAAAQQQQVQAKLTLIVTSSQKVADGLPILLNDAERALERAEREFSEGVFAPFWDAIEEAARKLATFERDVNALVQNAREHKEVVVGLSPAEQPIPFRLGVQALPDATHIAERMRTVVRRAQKDRDFATIYELRKTNQLLVTGFSTLGQAIADLKERLESSLDRLSTSVSDLNVNLSNATSEVVSKLEQSMQHAERESDARREHERAEREMLDNIQRRRKPRDPKPGDGDY